MEKKTPEQDTPELQTKTHFLNIETWIRLLYMVVIGMLSAVARMVIWVVAVLQFFMLLVTGQGNDNLRDLGQGVSKWVCQAFLFLTFNTEEKPFPFSDWPEADPLPPNDIVDAEFEDVEPTVEPSSIDDVPAFVDRDVRETDKDDKII